MTPVDAATAARAGDPVALARALVAVPSVNPELSPGGSGEGEVSRLAADWLREWGLETRRYEVAPGRWNVEARLGSGAGPVLLLNGHLDTVGVEGMDDPFAAAVRNGRLYGRGASDMKGGLGALLSATAALARNPDRLTGTLDVALTADEEYASVGMARLVEKGARADAAVVCEPTGLAVMPAHKGFVWVDLTFRGRAAHGSRPDLGVDAIRHAGLFLAALEGHAADLAARPAHPLLGPASIHAGRILGGGPPSVYPDRCELTLERRTLPGETADDVEAEIRAVLEALGSRIADLDASVEVGLGRPGTEVLADAPVVEGLLTALRREGVPERLGGMTAWVDAALLNEVGIPAVCFGPGSLAEAHTTDESCDLTEIRACARVLERYARDLLCART